MSEQATPMTPTDPKPLPCPHCGRDPKTKQIADDVLGVMCPALSCPGAFITLKDWNTRASAEITDNRALTEELANVRAALVQADSEADRLAADNAALRARVETFKGALATAEQAIRHMQTGISIHNAMDYECPGRKEDIAGPVVSELSHAHVAIKAALAQPEEGK